MQSELMDKYVRISRVIITLMVFIVLNSWFLYDNDPQWILSIIISGVVFFINSPSAKICKFLINKGDKIESKILKILYYIFALPIAFLVILFIIGILCALGVALFEQTGKLNLGWAVLIAFTGIGIFTYILVPYFQILIILFLRRFIKNSEKN